MESPMNIGQFEIRCSSHSHIELLFQGIKRIFVIYAWILRNIYGFSLKIRKPHRNFAIQFEHENKIIDYIFLNAILSLIISKCQNFYSFVKLYPPAGEEFANGLKVFFAV